MDWKQMLADHIPHAPFILATRNGIDHSRINTTRVLEGLIISGITGLIVMYGVQAKLDVQMVEIKSQIADLRQRIAEERSENIAERRRLQDRMDSMHGVGNGKPK